MTEKDGEWRKADSLNIGDYFLFEGQEYRKPFLVTMTEISENGKNRFIEVSENPIDYYNEARLDKVNVFVITNKDVINLLSLGE